MILYHGSNTPVQQPEIRPFFRALDFGSGFYVTSNLKQAQDWALSVTARRGSGIASVSCYEFDEVTSATLNILQFDLPDEKWLDFVVSNRKLLLQANAYDLVIGPVADDSTLPTINDYLSGRFSKDIAIQLLKPQKLTDQYAFLTQRALSCLRFIGEYS